MSPAYLVCATPRSGSTLLCEALKGTGVAGRPEEYFEAVLGTGRTPRPEDYLEGLDDAEAHDLLGGAAAPEPPPYSSLTGISCVRFRPPVPSWHITPQTAPSMPCSPLHSTALGISRSSSSSIASTICTVAADGA